MRCPHCNNKLIQKSGSETKIRTKGKQIIDSNNRYRTQCFWCNEPVELPLRIVEGTEIPSETFYVNGAASKA